MSENSIIFAKAGKDLEKEISIELKMANRHGFICGATGTGKTVTLKVISEAFSRAGVPVFLSDIKGDLSGMMMAGEPNDDMKERIEKFGIGDSFCYRAYPTEFFDVYCNYKDSTIIASFGHLGNSKICKAAVPSAKGYR